MRIVAPLKFLSVLVVGIGSFAVAPAGGQDRAVAPVLAFPEPGIDDPAAYQGYQTRFFRDARGNVVQIYLDSRTGRVVNLLADAIDESAGFTVRDGAGRPAAISWASPTATVGIDMRITSAAGRDRNIEYQLTVASPRVEIGWLLLGSMRVERDLQYSDRHREPFGSPTFQLREVENLVSNVERLPPDERARELLLLRARDLAELRSRLAPTLTVLDGARGQTRGVVARQASLDGRTHLALEISVDPAAATETLAAPVISIQSKSGAPVTFTVRVTTDGPTLTPLTRNEIFTPEFLRFLADPRNAATSGANRVSASSYTRLLERDVRGTELLSSREKLMAGLPNYATYFGRDMMMTSLMMEPIWRDAMFENVIASALRKLGPLGDVSHEEALGGQAIRENASEYNAHLANYFSLAAGQARAADTALTAGRAVLADLQRVRENYHMRDDEFQLPIIVARYLRNPNVSAARKIAFLRDSSDGHGSRISLVLREMGLVAELSLPYARNPIAQNLIGSPKQDATQFRSISWRDSNAGYANGKFAMDINAIWAPRALRSIAEIFTALRSLGFSQRELNTLSATRATPALSDLARDLSFSQRAIRNWDGAIRHFVVVLSAEEVRSRVQAKLASLPVEERSYWGGVLRATDADRQPFEFVALSLDENGRPIPVANTDPATWLFLHDAGDSTTAESRERALRDVRAIVRNYPVGLLIDGLGPVVANDAYAGPSVWQAFERDRYHSPRVVWGREVNLIMLGLAKQIAAATDASGRPRNAALAPFVSEMRAALQRVNAAVEASGLKHNELWSYEIAGGALHPIRYGASTDVQLWNVTDLAVQYTLWSMRR
jgi:hypothetical protein